MKLFISIVLVLSSVYAFSQTDKYMEAMQKNLNLLDVAKTTQDFQTVANSFARIGETEKNQWLPYYYAGLALSRAGWEDPKIDKDVNAQRIKEYCAKAGAIEKNSEIYSLLNMAATQEMMVDPQTRWQTYGQEASANLDTAMKLNPNNPRLYYLKGMSIFNTPAAFGGGKENAKPIFEKAVALYKVDKPKALYPRWGQAQAEDMLAKCQ
jgi:hypothetical protein